MRDILRELEEREEEARELRRRNADWKFIETLPPRVRASVILFVENGDLRICQRLSGLGLEDFVDVLRRARVWVT